MADVEIKLVPFRDTDNSYPRQITFCISAEEVVVEMGSRSIHFDAKDFRQMVKVIEFLTGDAA